MATTYYASTAGNDANNGLWPDASHASNRPWRTVNKALGAAGITSADTVILGPGVYREQVSIAMTSATAETFVLGDPRNEQGFRDGSGNLLRPRPVRITQNLTDDKTAATAQPCILLNGRDFLTFKYLHIDSDAHYAVEVAIGHSSNIKFFKCYVWAFNRCFAVDAVTAGSQLNWEIDSCRIISSVAHCFDIVAPRGSGSDLDIGFLIKNSMVQSWGGYGVLVQDSGAGTGLGGGIKVHNCYLRGPSAAFRSIGTSTSIPHKIYNNNEIGEGLWASVNGEIVEDFNQFKASTPRTNVSAGANSVTTYASLLNYGQSDLWGFALRPHLMPEEGSPLLGFGSDASVSLTADLLERARPSGGGPTWASANKAIGPYELHDFGRENTADANSGSCLELTGPGDHELILRVDATLQTPAYKVKYDGNYTGTNYPQIELLADATIGVSAQTLTATTAASGAYETLTFTGFTPTRKAWVRLRFKNRSAAGNGKCFIDS